mgnify:CR=1 FL=1
MPNLVGIGNEQVPTNAMLGGLAYQDSLGEINIDEIKAKIDRNVNHVFLYDTRNDSDGGAWRKKATTQSWYNEELGTADRGHRREFPSIVVITCDGNGVVLYDGDDPNLPMWARFKVSTGAPIYKTPSGTFALNGTVFVYCNDGTSGSYFTELAFIHDMMRLHQDSGKNQAKSGWTSGMVPRASGGSWMTGCEPIHLDNAYSITSRRTMGCAAVVRPDAPIDPRTGLPRPLIAVATNESLSLIDEYGRIFNDTSAYGRSNFRTVGLTKDRIYSMVRGGNDYDSVFLSEPLKWSLVEGTDTRLPFFTSSDSAISLETILSANPAGNLVYCHSRDGKVIGGSLGAAFIEEYNSLHGSETDLKTKNGLVAYVASNYNSGWMTGQGVMSTIADTGDGITETTLTNLVSNSSFASNTTGWAIDNSWSQSNASSTINNLTETYLITNSGSQSGSYFGSVYTFSSGTFVSGEKYVLSFDILTGGNRTGVVRMTTSSTHFTKQALAANRSYQYEFTADGTSGTLRLGSDVGSNNRTTYYTRISVSKVVENYTDDSSGLAVYGSVTQKPVAPGADLMCMKNWSTTNYIQQSAYGDNGQDLSFGSGDFTVMWWVNPNDTGGSNYAMWEFNNRYYISGHSHDTQTYLNCYFNQDTIRVDYSPENDGANYKQLLNLSGSHWQDYDRWLFCAVVRRGGSFELWINGVLEERERASGINSFVRDANISNASSRLRLGIAAGGADSDIEIALFRACKTAAGADQLVKIYNDERKLFFPNVKCSLTGSGNASNLVKAVDRDQSTGVAYIGTASGRSDFQGLQRINNTTTGVTTSISVSNGFIAEQ